MFRKAQAAAFTGVVVLCAGAWAAVTPIPIPNNSFEEYNSDYYSSPLDWTTSYSLDPTYIGTPATDNPGTVVDVAGEDGSRAGALYFDNNNGSNSTFTGTNLFVMSNSASLGTFAANTTYTLNSEYGTQDNSNTQFSVGYGLSSAPLTLATLNPTDSTSTPSTSFAANTTVYAGPSVIIDTATDPTLVGEPIYTSLFVLSGYAYGRSALYDDVTLTATSDATPEPAMLGFAAVALGGLLLRRRKHALS